MGTIIPESQADHFFRALKDEIDWRHDELVLFGRKITTKRKVAWHGDRPFKYSYSNSTRTADIWTPVLLDLKSLVEQATQQRFNSCLLNYYHDGTHGISWHSDDERELKDNAMIASLSFGATRKFVFRHKKTRETVSVDLTHGSLLTMAGPVQKFWQHRLSESKKVLQPRINLTFRTILDTNKP